MPNTVPRIPSSGAAVIIVDSVTINRSKRGLWLSTTSLTDPRDVSVGIAAALLTTALGLIVALITLFPYMVFRSHVERAIGRLESVIAAAQQGETAAPQEAIDAETESSTVIHRLAPASERATSPTASARGQS